MFKTDSDAFSEPRGLNRLFAIFYRLPISDRLLIHTLIAIVIGSGIWLILNINNAALYNVPVVGGSVVEGVLGSPRFINPVLATTRADRDLVALIFDGVLTRNQAGELVPNLATDIARSDDGTTYTITLRDDVFFHDGTPLTAADVAFTYERIKHPDLKSPLRGNWNNTTITVIDDRTVEIQLLEPYTPFIENLTIGIIPKHIWEPVSITDMVFHPANAEPVGSGPYRIDSVERSSQRRSVTYHLTANHDERYHSHLDTVHIRFFDRASDIPAALTAGTITSSADIPLQSLDRFTTDDYTIITTPLPRVFGVFFNQNRNVALRNQAVRQALSVALDRDEIVDTVTYGYGIPTTLSIPPDFSTIESPDVSHHPSHSADTTAAIAILESDGWERNDEGLWEKEIDDEAVLLSLTLRAADNAAYDALTQTIVSQWQEIGVEVRVEQFTETDLLNGIIRPRDFEAVVFGMDLGQSLDLYPFWHSSQQADPGLNIAQFASISTDRHLQTLRTSVDHDDRQAATQAVIETIATEVPALFVYAPTTTYVLRSDIQVAPTERFSQTSDRLNTITTWHRNTDTLWPIFHTHRSVITNHSSNELSE